MILRGAVAADFEPIAAIYNHYIERTAIHFSYEPLIADDLRARWTEQRATYPLLVADLEGAVVGLAKAGPWRERAAYAWTPETAVYVAPGFERRGIGRAVYGRLLEIMTAQGFHSAFAGIALPNEPSVRLHEGLGFVAVGRVARAGWKLGRWHDVGFWQKDLAEACAAPVAIERPVY